MRSPVTLYLSYAIALQNIPYPYSHSIVQSDRNTLIGNDKSALRKVKRR
jgi:hypothetical protein